MDLETALQMAAACETITLSSEDHREGVTAFREKRRCISGKMRMAMPRWKASEKWLLTIP